MGKDAEEEKNAYKNREKILPTLIQTGRRFCFSGSVTGQNNHIALSTETKMF